MPLIYISIDIVTGPSFMSITFMSAPKMPLAARRPRRLVARETSSENNGADSVGARAAKNSGRLPFEVSA